MAREQKKAPMRVRARVVGRRDFIRIGGATVAASLWACEAGEGEGPSLDDGLDETGAGGSGDVRADDDRRVPEPSETLSEDRLRVDDTVIDEPIELPLYPPDVPEEISPISTNEEFYIVQKGEAAIVDLDTWVLTFKVESEDVAEVDLAWLESLEARDKEHTLQCIESQPLVPRMNNAIWTGLPLLEILDMLGVTWGDEQQFMQIVCHDSYFLGAPLTDLDLGVWLVWRMNGEPLPLWHGQPARLLVPQKFGWKNAKQLKWLNFTSWDPSPLQQKKWQTDYQVQSLTVTPETMAVIEGEHRIRVLGKAYGGGDPVDWVGVSVDGGETWEDAELTYAPGEPDIWTLWRWEWEPPGPAAYEIRTMCTTAGGQVTDPGATDGVIPWAGGMAIELIVE